MKRLTLTLLFTFSFLLSACASGGAAARAVESSPTEPQVAPDSTEPTIHLDYTAIPSTDLKRTDEQGMVTFEVTPLNLQSASDTLEFDIAMNTHSVDLSMNLASLATLATDAGISVQASTWDAVPGGHHVSGKLVFPTVKDGKVILNGASKLTLTIVNVDAASRVFEWQLK